jgi:integrase
VSQIYPQWQSRIWTTDQFTLKVVTSRFRLTCYKDSRGGAQVPGWHTFRYTYRSWLDDTGAPMGVQQKLMRHAQISTTMNVYGNALMTAKREANSKVVRMALRSA